MHSGTGDSERRTRFRFDIFAILAITAMVVGITGIVVGLSLHKRLYWPEVLTIVGLGVFVRLFFRET